MKRIISFLLTIVIVLTMTSVVFAKNENDIYEYSVTVDDKEWKSFESKQEMIDACRIADNVLKKMTTEELLEAILDYPLLVDLYLFDSYEKGLEVLREESDAYREYLSRKDATEVIEKKLIATSSLKATDLELEQLTLRVLGSYELVSDTNSLAALRSSTFVLTPYDSKVSVIIRGELLSQALKDAIDDDAQSSYPNATFVSSSTTNYNCHSYAWYSTSTSNKYWMDNPSKYMTDGSYSQVTTAYSASRIFYPIGDHSAKVYNANSSSLSAATVISKWGMGPVMIHQASYGPYSTSGLTGWD